MVTRRSFKEFLFWVVTAGVLTLLFSSKETGYVVPFYFSLLLLPIVILTAQLFNKILIPKYLYTEKYKRFILYSLYVLVGSIYLEFLVITLSFILFANYTYDQMLPAARDVLQLTTTLYGVVFSYILLDALSELKALKKTDNLSNSPTPKEVAELTIRVDRKNVLIEISNIAYIESASDYVHFALLNGERKTTRMRISKLSELLGADFIRIHRSFLVAKKHIESFTREEVQILGETLPISRTYKAEALEELRVKLEI